VFGSLISSTDPITVLSLLPSSVDQRLYILIFGESALNDAVAIILFRFFTGLAQGGLSIGEFLKAFGESILAFLGSTFVGLAFALSFAKITKHVWITGYEGAIYELFMLMVFAYASYLFAEIFHLTGIISIFFTGVGMAHYALPNLTPLTRNAVTVFLY
jgi:solute carrier family 9 (sodium/hydrogen exchanger), member 8